MVAITVVSVINGSVSGAQSSLENTITREEMDGQSEALRFIQSAYIASGETIDDGNESKYARLWDALSDRAIDLSKLSSSDRDAVLKYNPVTCDEIYRSDNNAGWNTLKKQNAFIINSRAMSTDNTDNIVVNYSPNIFKAATTYPRIIYGNDNSDALYNPSEVTGALKITGAEGLYVIAVRDQDGTVIVSDINGDTVTKSAYIDFYIRSCWFAPGADRASTISTAVRLYDPNAVSINKKRLKGVLIRYGGNGASTGYMPQQYVYAGISIEILKNQFSWTNHRFKYWTTNANGTGTRYYPGDFYTAPANLTSSTSMTLYAQWEVPYTLTYNANGGSGAPPSQTCYYFSNGTSQKCTISTKKPTRSGYTFVGWSTSPSASSATYVGGNEIILNKNMTLYAVWIYSYSLTYYNTDGKTVLSSQTASSKSSTYTFTIKSLNPTKPKASQAGSQMIFLGWSENKNGSGTLYNSNGSNGTSKTITARGGSKNNLKLYPVWREIITFTNSVWNTFSSNSLCRITKTNSYIELRGDYHGPVNCGVEFGVGKNDNFELSADLTTSGIYTHPSGLVAVSVGPLVAIITTASGGGLVIYYGYLPLGRALTSDDIRNASNYTRLNQVNIPNNGSATIKLTKYGGVYTMSVNGNTTKIEVRENSNGTYNVYNSGGGVIDSGKSSSQLNNLKVRYTMIHTSHACNSIFNAKLYNIRMTKSDIYYN